MPYWSDQSPYVWIVRGCAIAGVCIVAVEMLRTRSGSGAESKLALSVVLVLGLAVHVATVALVPLTWDTGPAHRAGGEAILRGQNPYLTQGWWGGFPYPPLSAVVSAAGVIAGDVRWPIVVANFAVVALFVLVGRRVAALTRSMQLSAIWLWTTSALFVTGQAFYEPVVVALTAASLAAFLSPQRRVVLAGALIGIGVGVKQLGLGLIPFLPVRSPRRADCRGGRGDRGRGDDATSRTAGSRAIPEEHRRAPGAGRPAGIRIEPFGASD